MLGKCNNLGLSGNTVEVLFINIAFFGQDCTCNRGRDYESYPGYPDEGNFTSTLLEENDFKKTRLNEERGQ